MTKKLEELFNLPDPETLKAAEVIPVDQKEEVKNLDESFREVERISQSLPSLDGIENLDDRELDDLAKKAEDAYDDLMDLGMNVEVRYAGRIFEVAGTMMKNAIDAKSAKIDKKLKIVDLQLKKLKIDRETSDEGNDNIINGTGYIITDRNDLIKKLTGKA